MADDMETTTVLPSELRLAPPPTMPQARSYLFRQQSTLNSYAPGNTIQINIPRLQRSYLGKGSYLRFKVSGSAAFPANANLTFQQLCLDTMGAYGFINKIEVFDYLGSTVLETISSAAELMGILLDLGLPQVDDEVVGSECNGTDVPYAGPNNINLQTGFASSYLLGTGPISGTQTQTSGRVRPASLGQVVIPAVNTNAATTAYFSKDYAIYLPSFLTLLSKKLVPLHNGFTIVLTLNTTNVPFVLSPLAQPTLPIIDKVTIGAQVGSWDNFPDEVIHTAASATATDPTYAALLPTLSWTISDVNMNCQILELGPMAESMILSSTQGAPLIVHTKTFRNYQGSVAAQQPEFNLNLNLNVSSLTNVLWSFFDSSANTVQWNGLGARFRNFLQRWQFQYGSTALPQSNGIQTMALSIPSTISGNLTTDLEKNTLYQLGSQEGYHELLKSRPIQLSTARMNVWDYNWDLPYSAEFTGNELATSTTVRNIWAAGGYNVGGSGTGYANVLNDLGFIRARPTAGTNRLYYNGPAYQSLYGNPRFTCGINLELAPNKSGDFICGLNTNGMNTSIRGYFHPLLLNRMIKATIQAWAEYDAFINISPGIASTLSF